MFKPTVSHSKRRGQGEPQSIQVPSSEFWGDKQVPPGITGF